MMQGPRWLSVVAGSVLAVGALAVPAQGTAETATGQAAAPASATVNPAPQVVPALQQWNGGVGGEHLGPRSRIVLEAADHDALADVARQTAADLKDITGWDTQVVTGPAHADDIVLDLDQAADVGPDTALARAEGYSLEVTDRVAITARTPKAVFWGTRSLLQMLTVQGRADATVPVGSAVDWPNYAVRGFMLDIGRRWFGEQFIRDLTRYLSWYKMNTFQLHLNDNEINPPDGDWSKAYSAFRLQSDDPRFAGLAAKDGSFTHAEWEQLEGVASDHFVDIVPEFDAPAHARAFVAFKPELGRNDGNSDYLDLSKPETTEFMKSVFAEFTPWFHSHTVHMGADEYPKELASDYQRYFNTMAAYIRGLGKHPAAWGSLSVMAPPGAPGYDRDVTINSWNNGWYGPQALTRDGYDFINSNDTNLYMVPFASYYHGDGLDGRWLYDNWEPYVFSGGQSVAPDNPHLLGAMPALWNDLVHAKYDATDVAKQVEPSLGVLAQKMWRGVEPGQTYEEFMTAAGQLGVGPGAEGLENTLPSGAKQVGIKVDAPRLVLKGDSLSVSATVTNTGTTNLTDDRVKLVVDGLDPTPDDAGPAVLAPGASGTWSWSISVPADTKLSSVSGTVRLTALRGGSPVSAWEPVNVPVARTPHYVFSHKYDGGPSYKRLTRTITVPAGGGSLSFWADYDTEETWDYLFVEAHTPGADDWTTLPDANGHTSTETGQSCANNWLTLHPWLAHYQTYGSASCSPTGTTGAWNAATGTSGGWVPWKVDLSKWAGKTVEVSISYASDWGSNGAGVWLDDATLPDGTTTGWENGLEEWTVSGAPDGEPANPNDFGVVDAADSPAP